MLLPDPGVTLKDEAGLRSVSAEPRGTAVAPTAMSYASFESTWGTGRDASTPVGRRLGAERSLVQIQSPRLAR